MLCFGDFCLSCHILGFHQSQKDVSVAPLVAQNTAKSTYSAAMVLERLVNVIVLVSQQKQFLKHNFSYFSEKMHHVVRSRRICVKLALGGPKNCRFTTFSIFFGFLVKFWSRDFVEFILSFLKSKFAKNRHFILAFVAKNARHGGPLRNWILVPDSAVFSTLAGSG